MFRTVPLVILLAGSAFAADPSKDALGDALPPGAIARFGTERFRNLDFYSGLQLLPDGKSFCAMLQSNNTIFDASTGLPTSKVPAARGSYSQMAHALSADGSTAATSKYDGIDVWNFASGAKILEIKRRLYSSENTLSLSADGKFLAIGGLLDDKAKEKGVVASVWDLEKKKEIAGVKVAQNSRCYTALSGNGQTLATWGYHSEPNQNFDKYDPDTDPNRLVQIWNVGNSKELAGVRVNGNIAAVAVSPDGNTVAASPGNGEIHIWDAQTGKRKWNLIGRSRMGHTLTFSPDGKTLAASSDDASVQLFDTATGKSKSITACPVTSEYVRIRSLKFNGPDRAIALISYGSTALVWEIPSGKQLSPAGGHHEGIAAIGFNDGGKEILTATATGTILRWNRAGEELGPFALKLPGSNASAPRSSNIAIFPGGKLLTCNTGNDVCVYELPSGVQKCALPSDGSYANRTLLNAAHDRAVLIIPPGYSNNKDKPKPYRMIPFDLAAGTKGDAIALPPGEHMVTSLSPDGRTIIGIRRVIPEKGEPDTLLMSMDAETGKVNAEAPVKIGFGGSSIVFASDGKTFVLVKGDGAAAVYDSSTFHSERELKGDSRGNSIAPPVFSPNGQLVAIATGGSYGGGTAVIEVFDFASGKRLYKFAGHSQAVAAMAFSPEGKTLATGSLDTTALLWDLSAPAKE